MTTLSAGARPDRALLGAFLIIGAVFLMSVQDALVKYASSDLTLWQIYVLRAVIAMPALAGLAFARRLRPEPGSLSLLWRRSLGGWTLLRSALLVAMYVCLYAAVPVLSLATIAAAFYSGPLFITLLSALMIGEPVSRRGWLAIAVGFIGVLVMLRPGSDTFSLFAVLPVLSGFFYALAAVITRSRCRNEAPVTLALSLNLALLATGLIASLAIIFWQPTQAQSAVYPFLFATWSPMGLADWGLVGALAVLIVGIGLGLAAAYQAAAPVVIATFDYSYLVFATIWSYAIFSDIPDAPVIAGMVLIALAGLLVVSQPSRDALSRG